MAAATSAETLGAITKPEPGILVNASNSARDPSCSAK